jgi:hypothetical protein
LISFSPAATSSRNRFWYLWSESISAVVRTPPFMCYSIQTRSRAGRQV